MRDAIAQFDDRVRAFGDPESPSPPVTLRAACRYLFRRATPALIPVAAAVVAQFLLTSVASGTLTALGFAAALTGGVAGTALALGRRLTALVAVLVTGGLLVGPPSAVAGGVNDLFVVHAGLFGVVTLFVAAVCYAETARVARGGAEGGATPAGE